MTLKITSPESNRGQVGIGTLIVFIAMVLVAAIAAGVLINTAGFLQSQAEDTGEEATDEVSNQLQVDTIVGDANDDAVEEITMTVRAGAGSDAIDLGNAEILYSDGTSFVEDGIDGNDISVEDGGGDSNSIIGDTESTATVTLELDGSDALSDVDPLDAGEDAEIVITTGDGAQNEQFITAPDPMTEETFTF